jgi:hypothetical protein
LLQGQAVAISRTTGIYAFLISGLSRRKGERGEIGVARIEYSRTQCQKRCEEYKDDDKGPPATFHTLAPLGQRVWNDVSSSGKLQPLFVRNSFSHGIDHDGVGPQRL